MTDSTGQVYYMKHFQDCCEYVYVESIVSDTGSLEDIESILHEEIINAEEVSHHSSDDDDESTTWTFYKIDTRRGGITIRWCGSSNGYYSESVSFGKGNGDYY